MGETGLLVLLIVNVILTVFIINSGGDVGGCRWSAYRAAASDRRRWADAGTELGKLRAAGVGWVFLDLPGL
jgi:hypothetical protein